MQRCFKELWIVVSVLRNVHFFKNNFNKIKQILMMKKIQIKKII